MFCPKNSEVSCKIMSELVFYFCLGCVHGDPVFVAGVYLFLTILTLRSVPIWIFNYWASLPACM